MSFYNIITKDEAGKLSALGASFGTVAGLATQVAAGVLSLDSPSDTDKILDSIDQLKLELLVDFELLGDLIKKQAQLIIENENRNSMAEALSHTSAALYNLNTFLNTKNNNDLRFAINESLLGVEFFLNLHQTPPNVFYLPGLIQAGTVRILLIVVQDQHFRASRPDAVDEIRRMITLFGDMIDVIKQKVNGAHVVDEKSHEIHTNPRKLVIDGFAHAEIINGISQDLQFFKATRAGDDEDSPGARKASEEAENARKKGVIAELAFIGIPGFEAILQGWKTLLTDPNA